MCRRAELNYKPYELWPPPPDLALMPPYEDLLGQPSYEVCTSCGFELGSDDTPARSSASMAPSGSVAVTVTPR